MLCELLKDYPLKAQDIKKDILSPFSFNILQQIGLYQTKYFSSPPEDQHHQMIFTN